MAKQPPLIRQDIEPPPVRARLRPPYAAYTDEMRQEEDRVTHQVCGCPIGTHNCHRIDTGGYRGQQGLGLPYAVGKVGTGHLIMRQFATEAEASAYIGTLPYHALGQYYLDGPMIYGCTARVCDECTRDCP